MVAPAMADDYKVETVQEAPQGLTAPVAAVINPTGYRVVGKSGTVCEVWLARNVSVKSNFEPRLDVKYPLQAGELIGVIRFAESREPDDFRGQVIKPGTYTLRYGLQPNDGNHLGTSDVRDFLLACPPGADKDPKRIPKIKNLFKLSAKAAGTTHPAVFLLVPPEGKPSEMPTVREDKDRELVILGITLQGKDKEGAEKPVLLNIVIIGESKA
jgi:hypothetical protein